MIFIQQGDKPLTDHQIQKRTQAVIDRDWPEWKRERAMRTDPAELNAYMDQMAADTDINRTNNLFNDQLEKYKKATARLAQYVVADGRPELREMQPTGEQVFNETTGEMEDVLHEVVVQTVIEPLPAEVEQTTYDDEGNATTAMIPNPEIVKDQQERQLAQAVVENTPQAVIDAA